MYCCGEGKGSNQVATEVPNLLLFSHYHATAAAYALSARSVLVPLWLWSSGCCFVSAISPRRQQRRRQYNDNKKRVVLHFPSCMPQKGRRLCMQMGNTTEPLSMPRTASGERKAGFFSLRRHLHDSATLNGFYCTEYRVCVFPPPALS